MITFKTFLAEADVKLGGNKALDAFIEEFRAETDPNPFFPTMGVWKKSVGIQLSKWQGNIHISSIMSFEQKNAGNASKALKWVCELADKHKVTMDLSVKPIKNAGAREGKNLNKTELRAWYKRHGFVPQGADHMVRKPQ